MLTYQTMLAATAAESQHFAQMLVKNAGLNPDDYTQQYRVEGKTLMLTPVPQKLSTTPPGPPSA